MRPGIPAATRMTPRNRCIDDHERLPRAQANSGCSIDSFRTSLALHFHRRPTFELRPRPVRAVAPAANGWAKPVHDFRTASWHPTLRPESAARKARDQVCTHRGPGFTVPNATSARPDSARKMPRPFHCMNERRNSKLLSLAFTAGKYNDISRTHNAQRNYS